MIRFEEGNQKEQLYDMWRRIFHDTVPYTDFYFREVYGKNEILLEEDNEVLRGMLHLNPYVMQIGKEEITAHYIVGVSTEEEYRRQGVMRNLLDKTFRTLRGRKDPFTYLMPADEAYYLPFSFQFGMKQYTQEVEYGKNERVEAGYTVERATEEMYPVYAELENAWKRSRYDLSTKISVEYLHRLQEEVRSEFGCFFLVKKNGQPMGRFVVYAEDDNLSISQMVCYENDLRAEYLQQILQFLDDRYHFRRFDITYAEDWKENLLKSGQFGQLHVFETKEMPVIMFRILNLELLAPWLKVKKNISCILKVEDAQIEEQAGFYQFEGDENGLRIQKIDRDEAEEFQVDGVVDIATFTAKIFGNLSGEFNQIPIDFNEKAEDFWMALQSLKSIEISEIV